MSPSAVVVKAREMGLDVIGICDHNSGGNVEAVSRAGERIGVAVLGGMEITSREEIHMLGFFKDIRSLRSTEDIVQEHLAGENDPNYFGEQLLMDEDDKILGSNNKLLIGATDMTLEEIVRMVHEQNGIVIASHVDRPSFSLLSQLGFIPDNLQLDGIELSSGKPLKHSVDIPHISSSDAHRKEEIGSGRTGFYVREGTVSEIELALKKSKGRRILSVS